MNNTKSFVKTKELLEREVEHRFPTIAKSIDSINFEQGKIRASIASQGIYLCTDSKVCTKEDTGNAMPSIREEITDSLKIYIDSNMNKYMQMGMNEEDAKRKVKDSLEPLMGYDEKARQYVVSARPKGLVTDSLMEGLSIPMWNVAFMTKIFKQPFATSHAKDLVSVESFSNAWADVIVMFKEAFEGYGKLSTVAKGNVKQNNSNPITNNADQIVDEVYNISVDYESDVMEDIKARQPGNFVSGQLKADREKYGAMVLDRMQDALIYYGSEEAGMDGLVQVGGVTLYNGTPLYDILSGNSATKGSDIVQAMNKIIGDFMRENHYMAREVRINVSEYAFQALTQTVYSSNYNPDSPLKILSGQFKGRNELDGGLVSVGYTIISDTMCNPNTPFNPNPYDMMFITTPKIEDALSGVQDSLIIHPELIKSFIVPALWSRQGVLYTQYKRIGSVIAPIEGTVKVYAGLGYSA